MPDHQNILKYGRLLNSFAKYVILIEVACDSNTVGIVLRCPSVEVYVAVSISSSSKAWKLCLCLGLQAELSLWVAKVLHCDLIAAGLTTHWRPSSHDGA